MPLALRRISKILEFREILEDFDSFSRISSNFRAIFEDFEKLKVCDFQ